MKLIIGNWKLNPETTKQAIALVQALNKVRAKQKVVLCPPFLYLPLIKTKFELGAQDMFYENKGAWTGQISPVMLKQFKVKYAIIGHSERRMLGESSEEINLKIKAALKNKIQPILCVGSGLDANLSDEEVLVFLQDQLREDLKGVDPAKVIVAYEPVWAIGSGKPASPEHAERVAMFIKIKFKVRKVLYGGSSNASNAKEFLSNRDIDGLLVGGASLDPIEFGRMII